jgi:hypothetical protein
MAQLEGSWTGPSYAWLAEQLEVWYPLDCGSGARSCRADHTIAVSTQACTIELKEAHLVVQIAIYGVHVPAREAWTSILRMLSYVQPKLGCRGCKHRKGGPDFAAERICSGNDLCLRRSSNMITFFDHSFGS